jgi:ParB family chromosome partitioning protein
MSAKKRGLGRGLDALLGDPSIVSPAPVPVQHDARDDGDAAPEETVEGGPPGAGAAARAAEEAGPSAGGTAPGPAVEQVVQLAVDRLQRGRYQPRSDMRTESLEELAASIRSQGIMQPIVARSLPRTPGGEQVFEIIAGERRWRAAQLAGLDRVPVLVREVADEAALAMALIENIQRENLNPLEEARALARLVEEFGLTHGEAAEAVSRSRASVSNLLRLLELDEAVKGMLEARALEMGHARALLALPRQAQAKLAGRVVARRLSVRQTEQLVRQTLKDGGSSVKDAAGTDDRNRDIERLEADLGERLGATVKIRHAARGNGTLSITYNSLDELEGIIGHIK